MLTSATVTGWRALMGSLLISFGLLGCGGGQLEGAEYSDGDHAFRLGPVPAEARAIKSDEALVTLRNDSAGTTIAINGRCGLDGDDVPLRALVSHLFIQFTEKTTLGEKELRLDGRAALEVELEASLDGVRNHFIVVVLKKNSCVYDFIHVDPGGSAPAVSQSRTDFRALVEGFSLTE